VTDEDETPRSRRRVLQLTGAVTAGALAGCSGVFGESNPTVIKNVSFKSQQFVVRLKNETNADKIDLRSPSGELLRTASVGRKRKVSFPLFNDSDMPYPPGNYTLVAVETSGNEPQRISEHSVELTSSFSALLVRPVYEDPPDDSFTSNPPPFATKVRVTIANTGKLPVGIKYIGIPEGVPSPAKPPTAPGSEGFRPVDGSGLPPHYVPVDGAINFQSFGAPLYYFQSSGEDIDPDAVGVPKQGASWEQIQANHCNGETYTATLVIVPVQGSKRKLSVTFKYGGKATQRSAGSTDYGCTNVSVVSTERENTTTPQ
jgi:hypothetical protein